jgi:hypothetical protein
MKVIVAGGRDFTNFELLFAALNELSKEVNITEIVSGTAKGADSLGECWANLSKIPVKQFTPDWKTYGKSAGPIRNKSMAEHGDILILFWDGKSRGSKSMLNEMTKLGKPVKLFKY